MSAYPFKKYSQNFKQLKQFIIQLHNFINLDKAISFIESRCRLAVTAQNCESESRLRGHAKVPVFCDDPIVHDWKRSYLHKVTYCKGWFVTRNIKLRRTYRRPLPVDICVLNVFGNTNSSCGSYFSFDRTFVFIWREPERDIFNL